VNEVPSQSDEDADAAARIQVNAFVRRMQSCRKALFVHDFISRKENESIKNRIRSIYGDSQDDLEIDA
jgi:hypothetical protein